MESIPYFRQTSFLAKLQCQKKAADKILRIIIKVENDFELKYTY